MEKLKSYQIRQMWLDFWQEKHHEVLPSAPLVPVNDPTLLWINAGVAPLKKFFDGRETPKNRRMVNAQKSIRTNDIENVGKTARHHTFFEMLGNFSVGDYFRDEALTWALEVLTSKKWFGFDLAKLYFTVYPTDIDSYNKWIELGIEPSHIIKLEDNFWEIGEGPCGPDTEIFYDRGLKHDPLNLGIKMLQEDIENDRYIEIWNIVFSQFNAKAGVPRSNYQELPSKNIDTGMGLERMACIMQEVETNYDTDLFMPIIAEVERLTGVKYTGQMAFKVIADHIRSVTFAVSDGAMLSNEGRGYVLRRILRRAIRYGRKLGMNEPFMYKLVKIVVNYMSNYYTYLIDSEASVTKIIKVEEEKFLLTLEIGEKKLLDYINNADTKIISKEIAFLLYDTFGFPLELTLEVAQEHNFLVDEQGFKGELNKQKELSRGARNEDQSMNIQNKAMLDFVDDSEFIGYHVLNTKAEVIAIFKDGEKLDKAKGDCLLVFNKTVFYAESGGQIGDIGYIKTKTDIKKVINTVKLPNGQHASLVKLDEETITVGDVLEISVDTEFRSAVCANHSVTHLLDETLRRVLGKHVIQQGSSVTNTTLRFDFNNFTFPSKEEILLIEKIVNEQINKHHQVVIKEMPLTEAKKLDVQAVFGEKYGDIVRVVDMGFSRELCGGTHVSNTKDIARFVILSVESKGSGIFRIEATTKDNIEEQLDHVLANANQEVSDLEAKIAAFVADAKKEGWKLDYKKQSFPSEDLGYQTIINKGLEVAFLREQVKELDKALTKMYRNKNCLSIENFEKKVYNINNYKILVTEIENESLDSVKDLIDRLVDKLNESLVFVALKLEDKVIFVCKNKISALNAGALVKEAAIITKGNGGGRSDFAQAGGSDISLVDEALAKVKAIIRSKL
ncbi:MAG TPA: alanine--tRNA ligase [Bacilli bacterium]|nr:alanine--tRNA ligase [Bacilli bacterium]